jgi:YQGE family putative transporter
VLDQLHLTSLGHRLADAYAQLPNAARRMAATHSGYIFYAYLASLFVNIYLWKQHNDFAVPAAYDLTIFICGLLIFWLVALSPWRPRAKRLIQAGLLVSAIRYVMLIFMSVNGPWDAVLIGLVGGVSVGLYWSGNHALTYSSTTDSNRDQYNGLITSLSYISSIIAPALGGILIAETDWLPWLRFGQSGYHLLFLAIIAVLLMTAWSAKRLSGLTVKGGRAKEILALARSRRWRLMLGREFLDGMTTGPMNFIYIVLAFTILGGSEINLGIFSSVFALLGAFTSILIGGLINHRTKDRINLGYIGAALFAASTIIFVGMFSFTGIIASSLIDIFAAPLFAIGMGATLFHAIDQSPRHEETYYSYIVLRETVLTIGRVISIALFLLTLNLAAELTVAKIWYLALFMFPFGFCLLTRLAEKYDGFDASAGQA